MEEGQGERGVRKVQMVQCCPDGRGKLGLVCTGGSSSKFGGVSPAADFFPGLGSRRREVRRWKDLLIWRLFRFRFPSFLSFFLLF